MGSSASSTFGFCASSTCDLNQWWGTLVMLWNKSPQYNFLAADAPMSRPLEIKMLPTLPSCQIWQKLIKKSGEENSQKFQGNSDELYKNL